jgi:hypothetical protein
MATTETRTGFRLPWSQDHIETDEPTGDAGPTAEAAIEQTERPDMIDTMPDVLDDTRQAVDTDAPAHVEPTEALAAAAASPARKPNKLMVDLAKAMQTAAAGARTETLEKFAADAKAYVESINSDAAAGTAGLRRQADEDIAAIREWSKAEIARIREETESRISNRKSDLDGELEDHAASTERRIARVQARVDAFEAEMTSFFEVVFAEEDPTRLAAMAQNLPEPLDFDDDTADVRTVAAAAAAAAATVVEATQVAEPAQDADATFVAIAADTQDAPAHSTAETVEPVAADAPVEPAAPGSAYSDPRIAALGLTPDAAAEAEAESFEAAQAGSREDDIPLLDHDALAARIAGLVPVPEPQSDAPRTGTASTRVVVVGLVSVASIAGFKRHLGRVVGVQSVGVSSGPDGEFVFVVVHSPGIVLRDAIATLPGFGARVTGETDEGLQVTARDPEAEN